MPHIPILDDSIVPTFDPISEQTKGISDLFWLTLAIAMAIVMLVSGLIIVAGIKYRARKGDNTEPRQVSGNLRLEIIWTATPAVILVLIFIPTIIVMNKADPATPKGVTASLEVIGHQYWWEYRLLKESQGVSSQTIFANELHIPVGQEIYTELDSGDVNHDFWVPQLVRKIDVIKGQRNHLLIKADKTGYYPGHCAEFCGAEHAWMNIAVYVDSPEVYATWLANQKNIPAPPTDQQLLNGQRVFLNNTCVNCHAIGGTGAIAAVAPNLTHLGSRKMIGSGIETNTFDNLKSWIKNPQTIKPGIRMPAYPNINDRDLTDLTNYLESLK